MAVLGPKQQQGHLQHQLARSLERLLEEASHSGELKLSNRKLKEFPGSDKYDLSDTVVADLSRNRLGEVPEEVTRLRFLERLSCHHNAIRSVPPSLEHLQCLSFLDLSRNQLVSLPRELCLLPIRILVVSHNRLSQLPDELYRMSQLSELEASCNELTHFPPRLGELTALRALGVRRNLLQAVPAEVALLPLTRLDLRDNMIGALPVEMRGMAALQELLLEGNPLTSPPASLCARGRVHIFKYLEDEAAKLERKTGVALSGTLSRRARKGVSDAHTMERLRNQRRQADSGYSTGSDCNVDGRWSREVVAAAEDRPCVSTPVSFRSLDQSSATSTPSTVSPTPPDDHPSKNSSPALSDLDSTRNSNSVRLGPCVDNMSNGDEEKATTPPLHQIQTYREYKEALRQQRANELPTVYRTKDSEDHAHKTEPNTPTRRHAPLPCGTSLTTSKSDPTPLNGALYAKPVQKVTPSRGGMTYANGHTSVADSISVKEYVKPDSPSRELTVNGKTSKRGVTWGMETDKMSFTMRREMDKAREETDLINQLRNIIESRLKMSLPEDLAAALTDGVVLCHLANHIKPRSVASIHVPSPAVPKLTMARCRRNVDNFIEACRKIGVDEALLCSSFDVTEGLRGRGLPRLFNTVTALCHEEGKSLEVTIGEQRLSDATVSLLLLALFFSVVALLVAFPPPD